MIERKDIAPGDTTPFDTISRYSSDIDSYEVAFKTTWGIMIPHKDSRSISTPPQNRKRK